MSDLLIRRLDPADDADMDGFQEVYAAAELAEDPDVGLYSREDAVAMLTSETAEIFKAWGAFVDGRMVAESILTGSTRDNLRLAQLLLWVDPPRQRQGFGTQLLAATEARARELGRTILRVQARIGDGHGGNRAFAERNGYTLKMTEIERRLRFPLDLELLDRLATESAAHHRGYEIRAFVGPIPAELRASYLDVDNLLMVEMTHGDLELETGRNTLEDLDAFEEERTRSGRTRVSAFALRDGVVVAFTDASVPGGEVTHIDQFGTLVHPDHRGHRLGMAVKCAQLRLLAVRFPERHYVQTSNAEVNAQMVAINDALGFEVVQVYGEFEKRLA